MNFTAIAIAFIFGIFGACLAIWAKKRKRPDLYKLPDKRK